MYVGLASRIEDLRRSLGELRRLCLEDPAKAGALLPEAMARLATVEEELRSAGEGLPGLAEKLALVAEVDLGRFRELFESAPVAYLVTDDEGVILESNALAEALLGRGRDELLGRALGDFVAEPDRQAFAELLAGMHAQEGFAARDLRMSPPGARGFPAGLRVRALRSPLGRILSLCWLMDDLTARAETESALRRSEQQFRAMADFSHDWLYWIGPGGEVIYSSPSCKPMTGYGPEEFLKDPGLLRRIIHPDDLPRMEGHLLRGRCDEGVSVDFRIVTRSGEVRWLNHLCREVRDPDGRLVSRQVANRDVTARKRTEEELRRVRDELEHRVRQRTAELENAVTALGEEVAQRTRTEESLREAANFVANNPAPAMTVDNDGTVIFCNAAAGGLLSPQGKPVSEVFPWLQKSLIQEVRGGKCLQFEQEVGGRTFLFSVRSDPGSGALYVYGSDITERKQAEQALKESRHFIQNVANTAPFLLYVFDLAERRYVYANSQSSAMLGYTPQQLQAMGAETQSRLVHADDLPGLRDAMKRHDGAPEGQALEFEYRLRHADGRWRWIHDRAVVFSRGPDGSPRLILGTAQDVTDRRRLQQQVLEAATREQQRIGRDLHDGLGQDLTGVSILAGVLHKKLAARSAEEAQVAEKIRDLLSHAIGRAQDLIKGLCPVRLEPEGLMDALKDLAENTERTTGLSCQFECDRPVLVEELDTAVNLYYIAREAVNNALKHGNPSRIVISLKTEDARASLEVADDGSGIPPGRA